MALSVTQAGSNYRSTSGATVVVSSITASVGDVLVVVVGADNAGSSGVSSISSVTDSGSNSWTLQSSTLRTPQSVPNDGVVLALYTSKLTTALSAGSVTVNLSPNTTNVGALVWRVAPGEAESVEVVEVGAGDSGGGSSTYTITATDVKKGAVIIGAYAGEGGSPSSDGDTDTTNGSWSSTYQETQSGIKISSQYKAVTASGDQTFNGTAHSSSVDLAVNYLVLRSVLRLYLPSTVESSPPISPTADSGWEKTSDMDRALAVTTKSSSALTTASATKSVSSSAYDMVRRQYLYGPLSAGTITGQTLGVIRVYQGALSADGTSQISIRVIASDGTTVRGTALALSTGSLSSEWSATTLTNRYFPLGTAAADLTDVSVSDGDYLVLEIGVRGRELSTSNRTFQWRFGDAAASDLAAAQTGTTDNNPWIDLYGSSLALLQSKSSTDNLSAGVTEAQTLSITGTVTDNLGVAVTEADALAITEMITDTDSLGVAVSESQTVAADEVFTDTDSLTVTSTEADALSITGTDPDSLGAGVTESDALSITGTDPDSLGVAVTEAQSVLIAGDYAPLGLRLDVYEPNGDKVAAGPVIDILSASYELGLDRVGSFSVAVPADNTQAEVLTLEREVRIHRESEGLVFRGIIARRGYSVSADGSRVLEVSGDSLARQLVKRNTLLGLAYEGAELAEVVGDSSTPYTLLHGTGWAPGELAEPETQITARFDGLSRWEALRKTAEIFGLHVREDNLAAEVDLVSGQLLTAVNIVLQNVEESTPELAANHALYAVTDVNVQEQSEDLINRIVPLGAGEGINALTLRYATRTEPYTVQSAIGPDGRDYWYIQDTASVSAYGVNERVVSVKDAVPLANSPAGYAAAADALYDAAAVELARRASPLTSYSVTAAGLRHVELGAPLIQPGMGVRLVYRGITTDESGARRSWLSVDETLVLMGFSRRFDASGADTWSLTLNSVDRWDVAPADTLAQTFSALHALQVAQRLYTYHEVHLLERTTIDAGAPATMVVRWDQNVSLLHAAKLSLSVGDVRSNVTIAASGGGTTSSSGGGQTPTSSSGGGQTPTSSSGGGQTSSSGGSHSHSISGSTSSSGDHRHAWATNDGGITVTTTNNSAGHTHDYSSAPPATTGDNSVAHTHNFSGSEIRTKSSATVGNTSTVIGEWLSAPNGTMYTDDSSTHSHTMSGGTAESGGSHTHTVTDHTHTVTVTAHTHTVTIEAHTHTVSAHTHNLTYGVGIQAAAAGEYVLTIRINGVDVTDDLVGSAGETTATGIDALELDITQYLQDGSTEVPLQQSNTIEIEASTLRDISAVLRSRVTATSFVPVAIGVGV